MTKDSRIYVRASDDDQATFRRVAEALGQATISATIRMVMREKARELGLTEPRPKKAKR